MPNWKTIDELRNIFISKYTNSKLTSELEKACSEEYELSRDYNGRQILELLQNVDDAYGEKNADEDVSVKLSLKENILEVGNTGTSFTAETIERLCLGRASDKSANNIGNKGTGFRSLLNDAEWIEIHSGDFSIRFSENYTKKLFNKYVEENSKDFCQLIHTQKINWKKDYPFCFPILNCPEQIEKINTEFDTLIRVKVKKDNKAKETSIINQLKQPFYKSLLFLPNITKIIIDTDSCNEEYSKIVDGDDILIEKKSKNETTGEEYYCKRKVVNVKGKNAKLVIAVPKDENYDFSEETLYCYFPIRNFKTPIRALIHAPFITNNSRDDIPNDTEQVNISIFKEILIFIKEFAENLATKKLFSQSVKTAALLESKLWSSSFDLKKRGFGISCG